MPIRTVDSILLSTKKLCNVAPSDTSFDDDFVMWINGAMSDLHQLGIGPSDGFTIESSSDYWEDFLEEGPILNRVKNYVALHVRLRFDPPATSFAINMMKEQLQEMAWRLVAAQEDKDAEEAAS